MSQSKPDPKTWIQHIQCFCYTAVLLSLVRASACCNNPSKFTLTTSILMWPRQGEMASLWAVVLGKWQPLTPQRWPVLERARPVAYLSFCGTLTTLQNSHFSPLFCPQTTPQTPLAISASQLLSLASSSTSVT